MKVKQNVNITPAAAALLAELGAHLRGCRLEKRQTHEQVAEAAGFSRQTLSRIERGDPSVAIGQVARYANLVDSPALLPPGGASAESVSRRRVRRTAAERDAPVAQAH